MAIEQYDPEGIKGLAENTNRPVPGQSLTHNPDEVYPWEGPPEFTKFREALDYIVGELLQEEVLTPIVTAIGQGVPVADITTQMLYVGFREGKWNPDMLMMLIEPVMYVLMALSEKSGVDYVLYGDEDEDDEDNLKDLEDKKQNNLIQVAKSKVGEVSEVPQGALPSDIVQQISEAPVSSSLLERPELNEQQQSLLGR
jgi:hypothetical protein